MVAEWAGGRKEHSVGALRGVILQENVDSHACNVSV